MLVLWSAFAFAASFPAQPVSVTASDSFAPSLTGPNKLVDHSGLAGDRHDDHPLGHTMWLARASEGAANPAGLPGLGWVAFDLGAPRDLLELSVWNYNQRDLVGRGVRELVVSSSTDGVGWSEVGAFTLDAAPGAPDLGPTDVLPLGVRARFVLLTAVSSHGEAYVGLSEVRFTAADSDCAPPASDPLALDTVEVHPEYDRLHRLAPVGWLGGDIAHSVPLDDARSVWLFGDTFYGTSTDGARDAVGWGFSNGSVGIQDRTAPLEAQVTYDWGEDPTGVFAYEGPPSAGGYYWTTNGVALDGELYVFAMNVTSLFEQRGVTVIRVPNPLDPPQAWLQEHTYVDIGDTTRMFHSGLLVEPPWLYLLGFDDRSGPRRTVLARAPIDAVKSGLTASDYEYWSADGSWSAEDGDLATLVGEGSSESHVYFDPALGRYLYFVSTLDGEIRVTSAPAVTGPWTEPACVYRAPELVALPSPVVLYAARPHPELAAAPGEVVISYMTNSAAGFDPLFGVDGQNVYRPRLVRLQFAVPPTEPADTGGEVRTADTAGGADTGEGADAPGSAPAGCGCGSSPGAALSLLYALTLCAARRSARPSTSCSVR